MKLCPHSPLGSAGEEGLGMKVLRSSSETSNWSDNFEKLGAEAKKGEKKTG